MLLVSLFTIFDFLGRGMTDLIRKMTNGGSSIEDSLLCESFDRLSNGNGCLGMAVVGIVTFCLAIFFGIFTIAMIV